MRIATLRLDSVEEACVRFGNGYVPIPSLAREAGRDWPSSLLALLVSGRLDDLRSWHATTGGLVPGELAGEVVPLATAHFAPLCRRPRKIWGIGLNYRDHAADLGEQAPAAEPASFLKPDTTIIGPGDPIRLPRLSNRTTGEAELALILGRTCRDVPRERWREVVAGFCPVLDMTAEDILRRNPRNLTQSKAFDTFLSLGPEFVTIDEVPDVEALVVRTVHNGRVHAENTVARMTFRPDALVAYHSQIMTLLPGDILSTGTPGAAPLAHGDTLACRIDGFDELSNPVIDLKLIPA